MQVPSKFHKLITYNHLICESNFETYCIRIAHRGIKMSGWSVIPFFFVLNGLANLMSVERKANSLACAVAAVGIILFKMSSKIWTSYLRHSSVMLAYDLNYSLIKISYRNIFFNINNVMNNNFFSI